MAGAAVAKMTSLVACTLAGSTETAVTLYVVLELSLPVLLQPVLSGLSCPAT